VVFIAFVTLSVWPLVLARTAAVITLWAISQGLDLPVSNPSVSITWMGLLGLGGYQLAWLSLAVGVAVI
jgi:hypothetical protein